jgi:hypothetical protein
VCVFLLGNALGAIKPIIVICLFNIIYSIYILLFSYFGWVIVVKIFESCLFYISD